MDFRLPVSFGTVTESIIAILAPRNLGEDTEIMFLSRRIAELLGGPSTLRFTNSGPLSQGKNASNGVPHGRLLLEVRALGITGFVAQWINNWFGILAR